MATKEYKKITNGFVVQDFKIENGQHICTNQNFIASDEVDYEDVQGNRIDNQQGYFDFEMVQPQDMKK